MIKFIVWKSNIPVLPGSSVRKISLELSFSVIIMEDPVETSLSYTIRAQFLLSKFLGSINTFTSINHIFIKGIWISFFWSILSLLSSIKGWQEHADNFSIILSSINISLWPIFSPMGRLILHKVSTTNSFLFNANRLGYSAEQC